jgi:hypothetical protein
VATNPYAAGSRGVIPGPGQATPVPAPAGGPRRPTKAAASVPDPEEAAPAPQGGPGGSGLARAGGGFILAAMLWGWVVLPYLGGGVQRVKDTLRAKFVNQDPKGEWLP